MTTKPPTKPKPSRPDKPPVSRGMPWEAVGTTTDKQQSTNEDTQKHIRI